MNLWAMRDGLLGWGYDVEAAGGLPTQHPTDMMITGGA